MAGMPEFKPVAGQEAPTGEQAPRRRGRPPGSKNRSKVSLKAQIGAMLTTLNLVIYVIPPLQPDALDAAEIEALATALDEQAKNNPAFRRYLEMALTAGSGGQLFGVVAIIAARRAARHGMIPAEADGMLGSILQQTTGESAQSIPVPTPGSSDA